MKTISNNTIAFLFGIVSVAFSAYIFLASRGDPGLRMAALVAATGTVSALTAICSTLLTGKDLTKQDPPPGSTQVVQTSSATTTVTPDPTLPVTPAQPKN